MSVQLSEFVVDGQARAAASVFPATVTVNSAGASPLRFMMLHHPNGQWYAAAWVSSQTGNEPNMTLLARVDEVFSFSSSAIALRTEVGHVSVIPTGQGGCCGNRLRGYNPFGPGVQLAHETYSPESSE